jgi:hypothetical protein
VFAFRLLGAASKTDWELQNVILSNSILPHPSGVADRARFVSDARLLRISCFVSSLIPAT